MIKLLYDNIAGLLSLSNLLSFLLLLWLVFLGVGARISIDIEISKKDFKSIRFFPRYFLAVVLSYVIELYLAEHEALRKYYAEIIVLFCIFVNDIIKFLLGNTGKVFLYILIGITKGIEDLKIFLTKSDKE